MNKKSVIAMPNSGETILSKEAQRFLETFSDRRRINPYLTQNRFVCKGNQKEKYVPFLQKNLEESDIQDREFCDHKLKEIADYLNKQTQQLAAYFPKSHCYSFTPDDKIILGEGSGFYLNMAPIKLHPLYGLPFISASTIKGALRSAWEMEHMDWNRKEHSQQAQDQDFVKLFGNAEGDGDQMMGSLVFFDIFTETFTLGFDVQTPHFKEYYESVNPPTDDQKTVPLFLVCLKKSKFEIWISCRDTELWLRNQEKIHRAMHIVFSQLGIGAKTSLGYGIAYKESE